MGALFFFFDFGVSTGALVGPWINVIQITRGERIDIEAQRMPIEVTRGERAEANP